MSQWRIQPASVQDVLRKVSSAQQELAGCVSESTVTAAFDGLTWGSVFTQDVPAALAAVLERRAQNLTAIGNRVGAGIAGVGNATIAYQNGQTEMAGTFQREMHSAADSGDFEFFEKHGYRG
jgi:hypothetical protein